MSSPSPRDASSDRPLDPGGEPVAEGRDTTGLPAATGLDSTSGNRDSAVAERDSTERDSVGTGRKPATGSRAVESAPRAGMAAMRRRNSAS
ncbi:hypothetical protein [Nocardia sp. SYP-A9097]|uniref:hypothetical protein n=1 Tax=Nocardia sp. SYP-A9097 TaxID=2663237 RepID=UPI001891D25B|nr:hypothetical protein [Nocardia sp. SYP-A9097]